mmetsp:Transcript_80372/g.152804  ORF Transcript_80372/g.152804 Transcript_80372/m.152804 type:complete len:452 (-) Transcript_80372:74-1429(-)
MLRSDAGSHCSPAMDADIAMVPEVTSLSTARASSTSNSTNASLLENLGDCCSVCELLARRGVIGPITCKQFKAMLHRRLFLFFGISSTIVSLLDAFLLEPASDQVPSGLIRVVGYSFACFCLSMIFSFMVLHRVVRNHERNTPLLKGLDFLFNDVSVSRSQTVQWRTCEKQMSNQSLEDAKRRGFTFDYRTEDGSLNWNMILQNVLTISGLSLGGILGLYFTTSGPLWLKILSGVWFATSLNIVLPVYYFMHNLVQGVTINAIHNLIWQVQSHQPGSGIENQFWIGFIEDYKKTAVWMVSLWSELKYWILLELLAYIVIALFNSVTLLVIVQKAGGITWCALMLVCAVIGTFYRAAMQTWQYASITSLGMSTNPKNLSLLNCILDKIGLEQEVGIQLRLQSLSMMMQHWPLGVRLGTLITWSDLFTKIGPAASLIAWLFSASLKSLLENRI